MQISVGKLNFSPVGFFGSPFLALTSVVISLGMFFVHRGLGWGSSVTQIPRCVNSRSDVFRDSQRRSLYVLTRELPLYISITLFWRFLEGWPATQAVEPFFLTFFENSKQNIDPVSGHHFYCSQS